MLYNPSALGTPEYLRFGSNFQDVYIDFLSTSGAGGGTGSTGRKLIFNGYPFPNGVAGVPVQIGSQYAASNLLVYSGSVGIGTFGATPQAKLHVVGSFRYVDGNQQQGKFLTCDGLGNATWASIASVSPTGWLLNGNAATNPATHFVGTTDARPIIFESVSI